MMGVGTMTGCVGAEDDDEDELVDVSEDALTTLETRGCQSAAARRYLGRRAPEARLVVSPTQIVGYEVFFPRDQSRWSLQQQIISNEVVTTPNHYVWSSPDELQGNRWVFRKIPPIPRTTSSVSIRANVSTRLGLLSNPKWCTIKFNGQTDY
jgi:hypothetical protein